MLNKKLSSLRSYIGEIVKENIDLPISRPPENSVKELSKVINQYHNRVIPNQLQHDLDENVAWMFYNVIKTSGSRYPFSKIKVLQTSVNPIVLVYKKLFNRLRPSDYAKEISIDWAGDDGNMGTTDTPSYPSGHTCQAYYISHVLSEEFPFLKNDFFNLAESIAQSRVDRGVHYPSDLDGGRELAWHLYKVRK